MQGCVEKFRDDRASQGRDGTRSPFFFSPLRVGTVCPLGKSNTPTAKTMCAEAAISRPRNRRLLLSNSAVEQLAARQAHNLEVAGSSPARAISIDGTGARGTCCRATRVSAFFNTNNPPTTVPGAGRLIRLRSTSVRCRSRSGNPSQTTGFAGLGSSVGQGRSHGLISGGSDPSRAESPRGAAIGPRPLLQSENLTGASTIGEKAGQRLRRPHRCRFITRRSHRTRRGVDPTRATFFRKLSMEIR
jgi:hypothetical protein